jgi:mannose-6-phosphate isomerase-like protein (cupin superfamily)
MRAWDTPGGRGNYTAVMRMFLLLSFLLAATPAFTQTPATPPPAGQTPTPAPAQPRPRPAQPRQTPRPPTGRAGIALTVTDMSGMPLPNIHVELSGPSDAAKDTTDAGQTNFPGLQSGTYRLRFSGDGVATFEREVTLRAGVETMTIKLTRVEPPPAAPPPPPPAAPAAPQTGPLGQPQIGSLSNLADREKNTKERREVLLSCSANTRSVMLVLTEEQPQRIYEKAEATFYVVSGQGNAKVGTLQSVIGPGSFVAVPRATPFSLARQGNRPLIVLWTLSGEPCEQAR